MKKTYLITLVLIISGLLISCNESFLEKDPVGVFSDATLSTTEGVEKALNGAYSYLNGGGIGMWTTSPFADVTGSIHGGEYTKGSSAFDYLVVNESVAHDHTTGSGVASGNFTRSYTGVDRCNIVLNLIEIAGGLSETEKNQYRAEARFLRGIYFFHLKKCFGNIPFIDETVTDARVPNYIGDPEDEVYVDIWPDIIADFEFAMNNLPETQPDLARCNSWAAQCMLAKVLIYAGTYDPATYSSGISQALTLLNDAIANGVTTAGDPYALIPYYHDNFDAAYEHNAEYIFGVELSTLDGDADGFFGSPNANGGAQFWGLWRDPSGPDAAMGWGFQQPTEWWANHFRTDASGLPYLDMFDGPSSSTDTLADDYGLPPYPDPTFELDTQGVDPRLDWGIGRRNVDYLGWGPMQGSSWIRLQSESSPYENKKYHVWQDQVGVYQSTSNCYPAINLPLIRFAEVLLLAAEAEVRTGGSLDNARDHVNAVRQRMMDNSSSGRHWVKVGGRDGTVDAANYRIGLYPDDGSALDAFTTADRALDAILYERTLELGGEGHRFFDVVRFGKGLDEFNDYLDFEKSLNRYGHYTANYDYEEPKDMYYPIPTTAIDRSKVAGVPTLIQNPGY